MKDQEFPYRKNLARVLIEVEDINDHVPIFTSALYEGQVYESAAVGSAVVQVTALDKDKGENAELRYSIEAGERLQEAGFIPGAEGVPSYQVTSPSIPSITPAFRPGLPSSFQPRSH